MKNIGKIVGCLGVGVLCTVTGGLAAPLIGVSLAAGGLGMAGGTMLIQAVAGGVGLVGAGIASSAVEGAKFKKQNEDLRRELKEANIDNATKQKIIMNLSSEIEKLKVALKEEKEKNQKNEEKIKIIQEQLNDLLVTLEMAKAA